MLDVRNLGVRYGAAQILEGVGFSLPAGSLTAVVGPNGTGKSSLLKAMAGLVPAHGEVRLDDRFALTAGQRQKAIAYMPQDTGSASSLTVLEVMLLGRVQSLGMFVPTPLNEAAADMLDRFGLAPLQTRTLNAISGGQRQMVYLAQTLFRNPDVLLLDEPTAALDLRHQLVVLEHVLAHCHANGTIAVAAMHDLSLAARFADRMIVLADGGVVADGPPHDVLTAALLRRVYGVDAEIMESTGGVLHVTPLRSASPDMEPVRLVHP
jgi:iron complex transport system ATP-binding protein